MEFRVARPDELERIASLYHRIWHETQAPHQHPDIAKFRDVGFMHDRIEIFYPNIIVALQSKELIGLVVAKEARLSQLFVDTAQRGKGVGQKLLELAEAKLVAEGATRVTLNCLVATKPQNSSMSAMDGRFQKLTPKWVRHTRARCPLRCLKWKRR